jgi:fatty-acyl-CoA synthase
MSDILNAHPHTITEALKRAASEFPDRGIGIFDGRGRRVERRTYDEFWESATQTAARIATLGLEPHEPVIIALPTSWEWLDAWWGVVLAGGLPVAASGAGAIAAAESQFSKVNAIMGKLNCRRVISSLGFRQRALEHGHVWAKDRVVTLEEIHQLSPQPAFRPHSGQPDETAFLQLTSGSTGLPRGVMISHVGAVHNAIASSHAIGVPHGAPAHEWADAMVSWLPLYHDMGLIGCLMIPLATGLDVWLMRPPTFLARPSLWLEHLGSKGKTFAPSPNFGYQLAVERIKPGQLDGIDLSNWKAAQTGAEMIRPETINAFCDTFGPHGFDPRAFMPCYGLAEATLAVTFDTRGEGVRTLPTPRGTDAGFGLSDIVCNGEAIDSTEIVIRAPNGHSLADGDIGEVCIKGPGVFLGYYRDEEATAESLEAGWFRTGDLGFLVEDELYLTGRTKDVLIVHGHNLMPDELERLADGVTGGGGLMRSAAFSVATGAQGEQAILVVETTVTETEKLKDLEQEIRSHIGRDIGLPLADLVFVKRGRIPRTSSGKMQRAAIRKLYLDGEL